MIPPVYDESELPERLRRLLAIEIERIAEDLEIRRGFLVEIWSRHRDRGPLLDTIFSRWRTLALADLALIDADAVVACEAFYRELDELRLYFQFTQDMPTTLDERFAEAYRRIAAYAELAVRLLGGAPERPLVEIPDEAELVRPTPSGTGLLELVPPPPEDDERP
ncbi:MAG: hypothetical protein ABMB14_06660 [Myxococcota bacterium]